MNQGNLSHVRWLVSVKFQFSFSCWAILAVLSPGNFVPGSDLAKGFGPVVGGAIAAGVGLSLGGPTGYAINPARDLEPLVYELLWK